MKTDLIIFLVIFSNLNQIECLNNREEALSYLNKLNSVKKEFFEVAWTILDSINQCYDYISGDFSNLNEYSILWCKNRLQGTSSIDLNRWFQKTYIGLLEEQRKYDLKIKKAEEKLKEIDDYDNEL